MTVTEEGVKALKIMAADLRNAPGRMLDDTESVRSLSGADTFMLGPYKTTLEEALDTVADAVRQSEEPAKAVADILDEVVNCFMEIITTDRIGQA